MGLAVSGCAALNPAFGDDESSADGTDGAGASTDAPTSGKNTMGGTASAEGSASSTPGSSGGATTSPGTSSSGEWQDTDGPTDEWWDEAYEHRIRLEFDARPGDLLDFVALTPVDGGDAFDGLARDQLAFVDPVTQTQVGAELASFTPARGALEAWVQVPHWHSDGPTVLYLYFGLDAPPTQRPNPWFDYMAVWHLDEVVMGRMPDSAGNADAGAAGAILAVPSFVPGRVGNGLEFDGVADRYRAELPFSPPEDTFLVSAWVLADAYAADGSLMVGRGGLVGTSPEDTEWLFRLYPDFLQGRVHDDDDTMTPPPTVQVSALPLGQWHHYALLFDGESVVLYTNGNRRVSGPAVFDDFQHDSEWVSLGGYGLEESDAWSSRLVDGVMDEVRWRIGGEVGDDWVARLFENQTNPASHLSVGPVEVL